MILPSKLPKWQAKKRTRFSSISIAVLHVYSLFHILSVKTNYEEFSNLKRIEKNIEKSSIKLNLGFDQVDMK